MPLGPAFSGGALFKPRKNTSERCFFFGTTDACPWVKKPGGHPFGGSV